ASRGSAGPRRRPPGGGLAAGTVTRRCPLDVPPRDDARVATGSERKRPVAAWFGPLVAVAIALFLTRPVWGGRPVAGEDAMFHLLRAEVGIDLLLDGRLDGWFPRFYLGHQTYIVYGPGLSWAIALVRALTFGLLSTTGAQKVVAVGAFAALPPCVAFLARSYGLGRRAAGLAAVLSLLVSSVFGPGIEGLFLVGLQSHQLGAVYFCLALGALLRVPVDDRARWMVLGAGALALLAITHTISMAVLLVVLPLSLAVLPLTEQVSVAGLRRLLVTGLGGAGLTGFWLVPAVAHRNLRGQPATWATPSLGARVGDILDGRLLFRPWVAAIVLAAWIFSALRVWNRQRYAAALLLVPVVYLVIGHYAAHRWPEDLVGTHLANRGLGYIGIVTVLPLAALVAAATRRVVTWDRRADIALVLVVGVIVFAALGSLRNLPGEFSEPIPQLRAAAAELSEVVPAGARFATQRDYPDEISRTGVIHPETWLARASGRNLLNGVGLESSLARRAPFAPDELADRPPEQSADVMAGLGVTHVVTTTDALAESLTASERFRVIWQESPIAILAVRPQSGYPEPSSLVSTTVPATASLAIRDPEHLEIQARTSAATRVTLAIAWSPKWHGTLDGEQVELARGDDGLIEVELPQGASALSLEYREDGWSVLGVLVTVATVLTGAMLLWRRRRTRDGQSTSSSFSRMA
ncbi:MAG: hypothetical protein ACRDY6_10545, partial [Acidimicrobiia bacterium]